MAVKTKDELLRSLNAILGSNDSDEAITLMEDFSDTMDTVSEVEKLRGQLAEQDKTWRAKYKARFLDGVKDEEEVMPDDVDRISTNEKLTFNDLFKEE